MKNNNLKYILYDFHMVSDRNTGIGRYFSNITKSLSKKNIHFLPVYYGKKGFQTRLKPYYVPLFNNGIYRILIGFSLAILKYQPQILHASNFLPLYSPNTRLIVTVHDICFYTHPQFSEIKSKLAYKLFFRYSLRKSESIIVPSDFVAYQLVKYFSVEREKIFRIYEAADPNFFPLNKQNVSGYLSKKYSLSTTFFLVVGDFGGRKGSEEIIEAFQMLINEFPQIQLVFVVPDKKKVYISRGKRYLGNNVIFLEYPKDYDLNYLYNGATALVFFSQSEGFGLPLVEAMSCSTTFICRDIPVFREIGRDAGLYAKSTPSLTHAMKQLVTDPYLVKQLEKKALSRSRYFSWEKAAKQTLGVYSKKPLIPQKRTRKDPETGGLKRLYAKRAQ